MAILEARALPNAPDGYVPQTVECPSTAPSVRNASNLSANETSWLQVRRNKTVPAMRDFLSRVNIPGFDTNAYIDNHMQNASMLPNIGIAASGGGYRALLNGAGAIKAFDNRESGTTGTGQLGGLLQSATYIAGLSGGGWLVSSIMLNNYTTIGNLQRGSNDTSVWQLANSIYEGPNKGKIQILGKADYFLSIGKQVDDKKDAGYDTTLTDYWGRALSFQIINDTDGGVGYTWSSIQQQDSFSSGDAPMPILIADNRAPGQLIIPSNTTIYEFNPFEFVTWDPTIFGFVPMEFVGSNFNAGSLPSDQKCVRGFDNAGFVFGTSSSLFNALLNATSPPANLPSLATAFLTKVLQDVSDKENDIASWTPSPFLNYANSTNLQASNKNLTLVDGKFDDSPMSILTLTLFQAAKTTRIFRSIH